MRYLSATKAPVGGTAWGGAVGTCRLTTELPSSVLRDPKSSGELSTCVDLVE